MNDAAPIESDTSARNSLPTVKDIPVTEALLSVEVVDEVTSVLRCAVTADDFDGEVRKRIVAIAPRLKTKGFRPGKVPVKVAEQLHGEAARSDVAQDIISGRIRDAISEHKLEVVGRPEVSVDRYGKGVGLSFSATLGLQPKPTITGFEGIEVSVVDIPKVPEQLEQEISAIRERGGKVVPLTGRESIEKGDIVTAQIKTTIIEPRQELSTEPVTWRVGFGHMPPEFDDAVTRSSVGGHVEVEGVFPESSPAQQLRGVKALLEADIESLQVFELEPLTDEVAEKLAGLVGLSDVKSVADLYQVVEKKLEENRTEELNRVVNAEILAKLVEFNQFAVPQTAVDHEIRPLLVTFGLVNPQKVDVNQINVTGFRDRLGKVAQDRVRATFLIDALGKQLDIEVSQEEMADTLGQMAAQSRLTLDQVKERVKDRIDSIRLDIIRDKVLGRVREQARVSFTEPLPESKDVAPEGVASDNA